VKTILVVNPVPVRACEAYNVPISEAPDLNTTELMAIIARSTSCAGG
jgi:hypothetical protein